MNFEPRTTPVIYGEKPWDWKATYLWQCTWYVYWRFYQVFGVFPCYNDRKKKTEGYNNGKTWLENYKDATPHWFDQEPNIEVKAGDIIVFDGHYGHVVFVEEIFDRDHWYISQYNLSNPDEFSNAVLSRGGILYGNPYNTGRQLGLLRFEGVMPVERNVYVDQVYVNEPTLRVRLEPNLDGEFYCYCPTGYFNVLGKYTADEYTWYQIDEGKYIADIGWDNKTKTGVQYLEAKDGLSQYIEKLEESNKDLRKRLDKISVLANYAGD